MRISRPSVSEIERYVGVAGILSTIPIPTRSKEEWNKDHREFVLRVLLPQIQPPIDVWKITVEAYLTDVVLETAQEKKTFEQALCDGSSVVPDWGYKWGNIKDPWGCGHDYIYFLHRLGLSDAYGRKWGYWAAHSMYRRGWMSQGSWGIGSVWWFGLAVGGWGAWLGEFNNKPEKITEISFRPEA